MDKEAIIELLKQFSIELDAGNFNSVESVAASLADIASADLVPLIKEHLGIDRIVKFDLDINESFRAVLIKIMETVDKPGPNPSLCDCQVKKEE